MSEGHGARRMSGRSLRGYALALFAAACWATSGLTAKWLFTVPSAATADWPLEPSGITVDPIDLSAGRALIAFVMIAVYLAVRDRSALILARRDVPFMALFGIGGLALVHYTYFKTISLTNVATAILLEYLAPVIVLAVAVVFMGHRFTWALPAGVALSVTGCALVVGAAGGDGLVVSVAGIAWGLASACFFALYSILGSLAASRYRSWTTLAWGLGFAAAFWLVVLGPSRVIGVFASPEAIVAVAYIALVGTVLPFGAFLSALRVIHPANATVTATVEPVLAAVGAYVLFGEVLAVSQLVGGVFVLVAIAVVQLSDRRQRVVELPPAV